MNERLKDKIISKAVSKVEKRSKIKYQNIVKNILEEIINTIEKPKIKVENFGMDYNNHRIILYNAYNLATEVELAGCLCCPIPDYVIHFTTEIANTRVYLRDDHWQSNHNIWVYKKEGELRFEDFEETIKNIPHIQKHYEKLGVPSSLLKKLEEEIKDKVELHRF